MHQQVEPATASIVNQPTNQQTNRREAQWSNNQPTNQPNWETNNADYPIPTTQHRGWPGYIHSATHHLDLTKIDDGPTQRSPPLHAAVTFRRGPAPSWRSWTNPTATTTTRRCTLVMGRRAPRRSILLIVVMIIIFQLRLRRGTS